MTNSLVQTRSAQTMNNLELCLFQGIGEEKDKINAIRGKIHDGLEHWSVYDFISVVFGNELGCNHSRTTFYNLRDGKDYGEEVNNLVVELTFKGQGQRPTPTMTLPGLLRLLAILPGKIAIEYRAMATNTITRVMAGDRSLIKVIEANAESTAPLQQASRAALAHEPANDTLDRLSGLKRKYSVLDYDMQLMVHLTKKIDSLNKSRREGLISDAECNKLVRHVQKEFFPSVDTSGYIPVIDPLFIFWSAIVNYVVMDLNEKGKKHCIDINIHFADVLTAYMNFFSPYVGYLTTSTETQAILEPSLIPNPDHDPHEVRLQQLMLVQKDRQMTIYSRADFRTKSIEVFKSVMIRNKKGFFVFGLNGLKSLLMNSMPYGAIGYDEGIRLSFVMDYTLS